MSLRRCTALVAALFLASGCASSGGPADGGDRFLVALGDSFPAGVGAAGMTGPCIRSPKGWPGLLAEDLGWPSLNLACSGATIADVYGQLRDVPAREGVVVVLQVGGNTLRTREIMNLCVEGDCDGARKLSRERGPQVESELLDLLREIGNRVPGLEHVYVLTYPRPTVPDDSCEGVSPGFADLFSAGGDEFNGSIASAVTSAAAEGVPAELVQTEAFDGHGICSAEPWFHSRRVSMLFMHPNDEGHRALADITADAIEADRVG